MSIQRAIQPSAASAGIQVSVDVGMFGAPWRPASCYASRDHVVSTEHVRDVTASPSSRHTSRTRDLIWGNQTWQNTMYKAAHI